MRRFVLFADRPPSELRERAMRLRRAGLTSMTPKGMRALFDLANKYEAAAAERNGAGRGFRQLDRLAAAAGEQMNDPRRTIRFARPAFLY